MGGLVEGLRGGKGVSEAERRSEAAEDYTSPSQHQSEGQDQVRPG